MWKLCGKLDTVGSVGGSCLQAAESWKNSFLYCDVQIILISVLPSIMYDSLLVLGYNEWPFLKTKTKTFMATCNIN